MALTNAYGTMQQLRAAAGITDANNTDHDSALEIAGNAAARMIDDHCGRRFWQDGTVQVRTYCPDEACEVDVDDISTTTGLIVKVDDDDDGRDDMDDQHGVHRRPGQRRRRHPREALRAAAGGRRLLLSPVRLRPADGAGDSEVRMAGGAAASVGRLAVAVRAVVQVGRRTVRWGVRRA
jgi:hypothetical protein